MRTAQYAVILKQMSISSRSPVFWPGAERPPGRSGGTYVRVPPHGAGARIGLFGGTFNPPHEGHRLASVIALKRLRLDQVWWMVTPGNPLKENSGLPDLELRMRAAADVADHPNIAITGFEAEIGTRYTYDTIVWLKRRCSEARFVWIMGADNLANFHRWQHWQDIARALPIAVIDRPQSTLRAATSQAAIFLQHERVPEAHASLLADIRAPAFMFLHGPRSDLSSTDLRARGQGLAAQAR